uniref:Uncharacterized protein n=1 Tax=Ciona savignyi TaxID=51511 RepID=H2YBQ1_CIOSA
LIIESYGSNNTFFPLFSYDNAVQYKPAIHVCSFYFPSVTPACSNLNSLFPSTLRAKNCGALRRSIKSKIHF